MNIGEILNVNNWIIAKLKLTYIEKLYINMLMTFPDLNWMCEKILISASVYKIILILSRCSYIS